MTAKCDHYLRKCAIVPNVAVVRETISNKAQVSLFDVLLDGVEQLLFGDFHLRVGEARNFNDHVEDTVVAVGEEGDVMEGRDHGAILLDEDAVFYRVYQRIKREEGKGGTHRGCLEPQ